MRSVLIKRLLIVLPAFLLVAQFGYAQQKQEAKSDESPKKVIIIKKEVDAEGNEKVEKIIREGKELHEWHFDDKDGKTIEVIVDPVDIKMDLDQKFDFEQKVDVELDEINGEKHLKIHIRPVGGEEGKVIEWQGKGEIPEDVRKKLEEDGVFLHETDGPANAEKGVFIFKSKDGNQDFEWNEATPSGPFLGVVSAQDTKVEVIVDEDGEEKRVESPDSDVRGVLIGEVVEESAAAEAGLKAGDILKEIDGNTLENFSDLVDYMQSAEVGQQVAISYERDGQLRQTQATLTERKGGLANVVIERIKEDGQAGDHENVFIIKTDDDDAVKIHKRHRVVVITRGEKGETIEEKEVQELPSMALPDTELPRNLQLNDYALFPNPSDGNLRLKFSAEALPTVIKITDLNGKRLYRERLNRFDGQYDQNIDLSDLPSGLFLLTIEQGEKVYTEQIVLK